MDGRIWLGMCSDYWVGAQCCLFPGSEFECSLYYNCENGSSCWLNNVIPWLRGLLIVNICWRIIEVIAETICLKVFFFFFKWRHIWFSTRNALGSVMLLGGVLASVCLLVPISIYKIPDSNILTAGFQEAQWHMTINRCLLTLVVYLYFLNLYSTLEYVNAWTAPVGNIH